MTLDAWNAAVRPKVDGSLNLHAVLGGGGDGGGGLDFFVMLSSTVGLTGGAEQSNYAAGGTFQDAFARSLTTKPRRQGGVVVSLDLPVVQDVGFVAEKPGLMGRLRAAGWAYMEEDELHAVLEFHCLLAPLWQQRQQEPSGVNASRAQAAPRLWLPQETADEGIAEAEAAWTRDLLFSHLRRSSDCGGERRGKSGGDDAGKSGSSKDAKHATAAAAAALLASAPSRAAARAVALEAVLDELSRVLSVDRSNLDAARPLHAYGVDSLVAVSLRAWLAKELGADLSVFETTAQANIGALAAVVAERSRLVLKFEP